MGPFFAKRRYQVALIVLVLIGLLAFGAWAFLGGKRATDQVSPQAARAQGRPIPVRTALVQDERIEQVIGATSLTAASEVATIQVGFSDGFRHTDLMVKKVLVHEGDFVKAGQSLFELRDDLFQMLVKQNQGNLTAAEAQLAFIVKQVTYTELIALLELKTAKAEIEYREKDEEARKKEVDAMGDLMKNKSGSLFEYLNYLSLWYQARYQTKAAAHRLLRAEAAVAVVKLQIEADVAKAKSTVETARADLGLALRDAERCRIISPVSGIVSLFSPVSPITEIALKGTAQPGSGFVNKSEIAVGQEVSVDVPLSQVYRLDPIHVRLDYPQERIDELAIGQEMELVLDSYPKESFRGKLIRISPQVDPQLRVLPVVVEVSNSASRIKAGISGYTRLRLARQALTVPAAAVIQQEGKTVVFCVKDGRARLREIVAGQPVQNGIIEVKSGLAAGEEVVIFHNFYRNADAMARKEGYLQDNDLVDTDWEKWARRE